MSSVSSSSASFADEVSNDLLDRELEKKYLQEDLAYGGLNDIQLSESQESIVDENVVQQTRKEFQATTKYTSTATSGYINQDIDETVLEVKNKLEQDLIIFTQQAKEKNILEIKKDAMQQRKQIKAQFIEKMQQPVKIESSLINQSQELQVNDKTQVQLLQDENLIIIEDKQPQKQNVVDQQYKYDAISTSPTFDNTIIQQLDKSILDTPINLSYDNHYKKIGSVTQGKLVMFSTFFETCKDESQALAWGRVLAFDNQSELQGGFDPNKSQTQDACVMISGIKRVQYVLPSLKLENFSINSVIDWNEIYDVNIKFDDENFIDTVDHSLYDQEKFKKLALSIQNYLTTTYMVQQVKIEPVYRSYCFNNLTIPREPRLWLKVTYLASYPAIQVEQFLSQTQKLFLTVQSGTVKPLDLFLALNQIKAASWIEFKGFDVNSYKQRITEIQTLESQNKSSFKFQIQQKIIFQTQTYHEFQIDLQVGEIKTAFLHTQHSIPPPHLSCCYLSFRYSSENSIEEPVMATLTFSQQVSLNQNVPNQQSNSQTFVIGRRIKSFRPFKTGSLQMSSTEIGFEDSEKNNIINIKLIECEKEIDLFAILFKLLGELNPDVIVCHQLYGQFTNIMKRICKNIPWHIIQTELIRFSSKLTKTNLYQTQFSNDKSDFQSIIRSLFSGRLIIDLEKQIRELTPDDKQTTVEYTLNVLINQDLVITPSFFFMEKYKDTAIFKQEFLPELMRENFAVIKICKELSILPLTSKIAQLTYFQWNNVLNLGRAKRVEFLLLLNFLKTPFIIPDFQPVENSSNQPKFAGGFVLDPILGLYDSVILVLDFNSLYPSIIREYDICFTTVPPSVSMDSFLDEVENLKQFKFSCQLPKIIAQLVLQRQEVKKLIKEKQAQIRGSSSNERAHLEQQMQQLDIQQLALKLCANSMYGSLGYQMGRFYCPKVAASIPFKGRHELTNAVIAAKELGYEVVYGDTDSIMVDTGMRFLQLNKQIHGEQNASIVARTEIENLYKKVAGIAQAISSAVSTGKKFLELGLDYIFVKQLLLAKKKYAALKINSNQVIQLEVRGLDMVRRDWCDISRDFSRKILEILMWQTKSEAIENVMSFCEFIRSSFAQKQSQIGIHLFKMTKSISKPISQYGSQGNDLAHVHVAKMMIKRGKIVKPGQIIEYLVLNPQVLREKFKTEPTNFASQCVPFEDVTQHLSGCHPTSILDMDFYLTGQILPPLVRLCGFIPDLSQYQLAAALGIEIQQAIQQQTDSRVQVAQDLRDVYSQLSPFVYACKCGSYRAWPESEDVFSVNLDDRSKAVRGSQKSGSLLDFDDFLMAKCTKCGAKTDIDQVYHSLLIQFQYFKKTFYSSIMACSNQNCSNYIDFSSKISIQKGSLEFKSNFPQQSNLGANCLAGACSGEMSSVFSIQQYRNQLQFISELFNPNNPFYKSDVGQLQQGYSVFQSIHSFVEIYLDQQDVMFVDVQEMINGLKWE
ncbi:DNA polymerase [Spironucleus salmonicida]|uniref:DNA polymerase n=1 Tax=Spironucleus salmonicida TaxID=348837 RepID=V6LWX8_9EUKA|nr:DNA polymerase [Spironucleus salmonicida]|eukprot:EST45309.1 DNA polymerase alpha subunit A [Spironucleus salmonicida]